jgi:hypothetical protein
MSFHMHNMYNMHLNSICKICIKICNIICIICHIICRICRMLICKIICRLICRICWQYAGMSCIDSNMQNMSKICIICYVDFQYAQYAFPTLLMPERDQWARCPRTARAATRRTPWLVLLGLQSPGPARGPGRITR